MGFFDLFGKNKARPATKKQSGSARTPEQVVLQALSAQGVCATETEVKEVMGRLRNLIDFKLVLPEELAYSRSAELEFTGSSYVVRLSVHLLDGAGKLSERVRSTLMSCADCWAGASEIAKAKGVKRFALETGQKIAMCDYSHFGEHPIYALFPELLNKTVLR